MPISNKPWGSIKESDYKDTATFCKYYFKYLFSAMGAISFTTPIVLANLSKFGIRRTASLLTPITKAIFSAVFKRSK